MRALTDSIQDSVEVHLASPLLARLRYLARLFVRIPYGRAIGIKREGLNYYPDAPYNLAVAAAGPRWSMKIARVALPLAVVSVGDRTVAGTWLSFSISGDYCSDWGW